MNTEISGEILYEDQLKYFVYARKKGFLVLVIASFALSFAVYFLEMLSFFHSVLYIFLMPVTMLLLIYLLAIILMKKNYKNTDRKMHERVVRVNDNGIEYGAKENQIFFQWNNFQKIVFLKELIILYISANQVIIIPHHFFTSPQEKTKWATFIQKHLSEKLSSGQSQYKYTKRIKMDSEITGKLTYGDFLQTELYRRRYSFVLGPLFILLMNYIFSAFGNIAVIADMLLTYIAPIATIIGSFVVISVMERRNYNSLDERFHERKVGISEEGIYYGIPENQESISWSTIRKVVFMKRFIILYTKNKRPLLIPKHFFSSLEEEKEWIDFIKRHLPN